MSQEPPRLTHEQVETMELAPGARAERLQGWVPALAGESELRDALEKAFDYRGDVTLTLKSGETFEAYIFDRHTGATLADSFVRFFRADSEHKHKAPYADIAALSFSGKDCAAGKHWEDWVRKYNERKAAGETGIALHPENLD
ncbi:MAG TPA: hypothetical protein VFE31_00040 [Opitutaceae bacterium]|jgi:hypothetical protein|nr:hypothetical protein [Opitutaceae bacterium]